MNNRFFCAVLFFLSFGYLFAWYDKAFINAKQELKTQVAPNNILGALDCYEKMLLSAVDCRDAIISDVKMYGDKKQKTDSLMRAFLWHVEAEKIMETIEALENIVLETTSLARKIKYIFMAAKFNFSRTEATVYSPTYYQCVCDVIWHYKRILFPDNDYSWIRCQVAGFLELEQCCQFEDAFKDYFEQPHGLVEKAVVSSELPREFHDLKRRAQEDSVSGAKRKRVALVIVP